MATNMEVKYRIIEPKTTNYFRLEVAVLDARDAAVYIFCSFKYLIQCINFHLAKVVHIS